MLVKTTQQQSGPCAVPYTPTGSAHKPMAFAVLGVIQAAGRSTDRYTRYRRPAYLASSSHHNGQDVSHRQRSESCKVSLSVKPLLGLPLLGAVRFRRAVVAARPRVYLYQYPDLED